MEQGTTKLPNEHLELLPIESNALYEGHLFSGLNTDEGFKVINTEFCNSTFKNCKTFKISFFD